MNSKREWTKPQLEIVTLEHDKDVLAACFTPSDSRQGNVGDNGGCPAHAGASANCPAK